MVKLYDEATGALIGALSDADFAFMQGDLEEESTEDTNYYLSQDTVDWLEQQGGSKELISLLRKALGDKPDMDIHWERE